MSVALHTPPDPTPLSAEAWATVAAAHTRDSFEAAHPYPFLAISPPVSGDSGEFFTQMGMGAANCGGTGDPKRPDKLGSNWVVIPVIKSDANPYQNRIIVGRARNCDVTIADPTVSKVHAELRETDAGTFQLMDRGSRNGTAVEGTPCLVGEPAKVSNGNLLRFGAIETVFLDAGSLFDRL